jgi:ribosomal protein L25 (general stress protein Ctc)
MNPPSDLALRSNGKASASCVGAGPTSVAASLSLAPVDFDRTSRKNHPRKSSWTSPKVCAGQFLARHNEAQKQAIATSCNVARDAPVRAPGWRNVFT